MNRKQSYGKFYFKMPVTKPDCFRLVFTLQLKYIDHRIKIYNYIYTKTASAIKMWPNIYIADMFFCTSGIGCMKRG